MELFAPEPREMENYEFIHYLDQNDNEVHPEDIFSLDNYILLKPVYKPIEYTIEFYLGEELLADLTLTYTHLDTVELPPLVKAGYLFNAWFESPDLTGSPVSVIHAGTTGNKKFYASVEETDYLLVDVTFVLNGGKLTASDMIDLRDDFIHIEATSYNNLNRGDYITVSTIVGTYWYKLALKKNRSRRCVWSYKQGWKWI